MATGGVLRLLLEQDLVEQNLVEQDVPNVDHQMFLSHGHGHGHGNGHASSSSFVRLDMGSVADTLDSDKAVAVAFKPAGRPGNPAEASKVEKMVRHTYTFFH